MFVVALNDFGDFGISLAFRQHLHVQDRLNDVGIV